MIIYRRRKFEKSNNKATPNITQRRVSQNFSKIFKTIEYKLKFEHLISGCPYNISKFG